MIEALLRDAVVKQGCVACKVISTNHRTSQNLEKYCNDQTKQFQGSHAHRSGFRKKIFSVKSGSHYCVLKSALSSRRENVFDSPE